MASLEQIREQKKKVKTTIKDMIKENPQVGPYDFLVMQLKAKGVDVGEARNTEEIKEKYQALNMKDKREIKKNLNVYSEEYQKALSDIKRNDFSKAIKLPKKVLDVVVKGGTAGIAVAETVNGVVPNLLPTLAGYIAGSSSMNVLAKLGLISLGAFSTPQITTGAIIAVGAVAGSISYAIGKGVMGLIKAIKNKSAEKRINKINEQNKLTRGFDEQR